MSRAGDRYERTRCDGTLVLTSEGKGMGSARYLNSCAGWLAAAPCARAMLWHPPGCHHYAPASGDLCRDLRSKLSGVAMWSGRNRVRHAQAPHDWIAEMRCAQGSWRPRRPSHTFLWLADLGKSRKHSLSVLSVGTRRSYCYLDGYLGYLFQA